MQIKKIIITGPESTGKSTLCEQLACHYGCFWVPEYAREYLTTHGPQYLYEDLFTIAKGQIGEEEKWLQKSMEENIETPVLFIDTCMYVMKVWSEYVFNDCDHYILRQIATRSYDGYLLCNTDLPWAEDELREHPNPKERETLFRYYADALVQQHVPWKIIEGNHKERLEGAVSFVDRVLSV